LGTDGVEDDPEGWTFWKIKHGIRWTGMPAWKDELSDQQIWTLALFLKHMDKLPTANCPGLARAGRIVSLVTRRFLRSLGVRSLREKTDGRLRIRLQSINNALGKTLPAASIKRPSWAILGHVMQCRDDTFIN
jgi:hypothetical protein